MELAIGIVNHNTKEYLKECLESIYTHTKLTNFKIYIVDNASTDDSVAFIRNNYSDITLLINDKKCGFTENNNKILKIVDTKYTLLLNPDTKLLNNAIDLMIEFIEENEECAVLGPKVLNEDLSLQLSCRRFPSKDIKLLLAGLFHNTFLGKIFKNNPFTKEYLMQDFDHNRIEEVDWVSGCCMLVRNEVIRNCGYLDERFKMYVEDVDLCYRVRKAGYKVYYYPFSEVIHIGGGATSKEAIRCIIEHHKSMYKFYEKHYKVKGKLKFIVISGLITRCLIALLQNRIGYLGNIVRTIKKFGNRKLQ